MRLQTRFRLALKGLYAPMRIQMFAIRSVTRSMAREAKRLSLNTAQPNDTNEDL